MTALSNHLLTVIVHNRADKRNYTFVFCFTSLIPYLLHRKQSSTQNQDPQNIYE